MGLKYDHEDEPVESYCYIPAFFVIGPLVLICYIVHLYVTYF